MSYETEINYFRRNEKLILEKRMFQNERVGKQT